MATLPFLFVVLPLAMAVFLLCPPVWRPGAMLGLSLAYYVLMQPGSLPLLLASLSADWLAVSIMGRWENNTQLRRVCVAFSVVKSVALLAVAEGLRQMSILPEPVFGLQVFCLSSVSCVLERYQNAVPAERSPVGMALYCVFFPRLEAGPLLSYQSFRAQLRAPNPRPLDMARGFALFLEGAVKVSVLGSALQTLYDTLRALPEAEQSVAGAWCGMLVLALATYYRLAGCAAMARGVAAMMGIALPQNFYYPYQSQSVTDFFERFHMTLTAFLRRRVITPLRSERSGAASEILTLLLAGMLFGMWFGFTVNYLLWGAFLSLFSLLEKHVWPGLLRAMPTFFMRLYTFFAVLCSFALYAGNTPGESLRLLRRMFGLGEAPLFHPGLGYQLSSNWLLLAVSLLFAISAVSRLLAFLRERAPALSAAVLVAVSAGLLAVFMAFSVG